MTRGMEVPGVVALDRWVALWGKETSGERKRKMSRQRPSDAGVLGSYSGVELKPVEGDSQYLNGYGIPCIRRPWDGKCRKTFDREAGARNQ